MGGGAVVVIDKGGGGLVRMTRLSSTLTRSLLYAIVVKSSRETQAQPKLENKN